MNKRSLLLLAFAGAAGMARAQDAHLSQFDQAPVLLNPALTGMFERSDFRISTNVRSQWNRLSSNFLTTAFSYDLALQDRYGAGVYLSNYDMAGMLNTFEVGAAGAYNVSGKEAHHTLSVGLRAGIIHKKVNDADLLYDAQYSDGYFDPDLPTGELVQRKARLLPELALGMAYRSVDINKRFNPFVNMAVFHVTTPDESIWRSTRSDLPMRWSFMGGVQAEVNDGLLLSPMALVMFQGKDREINAGILGECAVGSSAYSVLFGGSYRIGDAAIAQAGLKHKSNLFRVSYDMSTSPLGTYNGRMGAFEFSFTYCGTHSGRDRRSPRTRSFAM